jgi:hypothetical protein
MEDDDEQQSDASSLFAWGILMAATDLRRVAAG